MLDAKNLLGNINSNGLVGKMLGGMATKNFAAGLLAGGAATSILGTKDTIETVAKVGGLALLGTLAYKAFNNYQETKTMGGNATVVGSVKQSAQGMLGQASGLIANLKNANAPQQALPSATEQVVQNPELTLSVIRAMVSAAKADEKMDDAEMKKIIDNIEATGISSEEKSILMREFANNHDASTIAQGVKKPEEAAEVYLAALLVCDSQCENEKIFLNKLATSLNLDSNFTNSLQNELLAINAKQAA
jgi:uncharacterized membrane protein YebE (DUF533 family)